MPLHKLCKKQKYNSTFPSHLCSIGLIFYFYVCQSSTIHCNYFFVLNSQESYDDFFKFKNVSFISTLSVLNFFLQICGSIWYNFSLTRTISSSICCRSARDKFSNLSLFQLHFWWTISLDIRFQVDSFFFQHFKDTVQLLYVF